ncbi:MAG TPA: Uma2 family endonuclease [Acidobacteriaceae bacterium]|jgi:Uma2 family endonuclease
MATSALISVEEYLRSDWSPDREYVDGEIQERNLGEYDHATLQNYLLFLFQTNARLWRVKARPELRVQVAPQRFRVPDVTVLRDDHPAEQIIVTQPLLCIEILSPDDRFGRMDQKITDYLQMGVRSVWVIDPLAKTGYDCHGGHLSMWKLATRLRVPDTAIDIDVDALYASLD